MLDLRRREGRPLVVGHRGAPRLAPENTIAAFAAAVDLGVDMVELDVLALRSGPLVVAHSDRLEEITHGAASGPVGARTLDELRALAPGLPTLDETLAWFAGQAPAVALHVDLKLRDRVEEVADALERFGLAGRAVVSSVHAPDLARVRTRSAGVLVALTYPRDRLGIGGRRLLRPAVRAALAAARGAGRVRLPPLVRRAGADALMLQHGLVTRTLVARLHRLGVPVLAWTVDEPAEMTRVIEAGVDGVITNEPGCLLATLAT